MGGGRKCHENHGKSWGKTQVGEQEFWLKNMKRCVDCVPAPGPTAGGPAVLPVLGLGMGVIVTQWVALHTVELHALLQPLHCANALPLPCALHMRGGGCPSPTPYPARV